jgi:hypothetical protein
MDIFEVFIALLVFLGVLIVGIFVVIRRSKSTPSFPKEIVDLQKLEQIIGTDETSAKELAEALNLIAKEYGQIGKDAEFGRYQKIIVAACAHPNMTSKILLHFDKSLADKNPKYKKEINKAIRQGLNSREI